MVYQRLNFKFGGLIMYSVIEKDEDHILLEFYGGTLYVSDKGLFAGTELNDLVYWNGSTFVANPEKTAEKKSSLHDRLKKIAK